MDVNKYVQGLIQYQHMQGYFVEGEQSIAVAA